MAARFVLAQSAVAAVVSLGFLLSGPRAALAALVGGLAIAAGNAVFAWRLFGSGIAPARAQVGAAYAGEALKWLVVGVLFYLAIAQWQLPFLPLIVAVCATQFAFWIGLVVFR